MGPRTVNVEPIHWPNTRPRDEEIAEMVEWFKQRERRLSRRANTRATPTTAPIIWAPRTYQNLTNFNRCGLRPEEVASCSRQPGSAASRSATRSFSEARLKIEMATG